MYVKRVKIKQLCVYNMKNYICYVMQTKLVCMYECASMYVCASMWYPMLVALRLR